MRVKTTRFGILEIDDKMIINFPRGIPGFEELSRFIILPAREAEDFRWLQAVDDPDVALLVIDPFKFFGGYSVDIPQDILAELKIKEPSDTLLLTTVTIPRDNPEGTTANLLAPIILNLKTNKAVQVILKDSPYSTKHRLFSLNQSSQTITKDHQKRDGEGK